MSAFWKVKIMVIFYMSMVYLNGGVRMMSLFILDCSRCLIYFCIRSNLN